MKNNQWNEWFAWHPIFMDNRKYICWLKTVQRKYDNGWVYRD